jgi:fumarate hydratase subunit beta
MEPRTGRIRLPLTREKAAAIAAGDLILLSGVLYVARDAAHQRFMAILDRGGSLPFPIEDACLYYMGPSPAAPGQIIGSAGPTTSSRMDPYTPRLLGLGLRGMIGKGKRSAEVIEAMQRAGAVYFGAIGGAGALLAERIRACEPVAFEDLGAEAALRLVVEDFPVTAIIDSRGNNLYETGPAAYLRSASAGSGP